MRAKMLLPLLLLLPVSRANAQTLPKVHLGADFVVAEPQQEFSNYVNTSYGGSLNVLWTPEPLSSLDRLSEKVVTQALMAE